MNPSTLGLWLVGQFAAPNQREAILGDLQEEFAEIAAKSGVAEARQWFRRHAARTLLHLIVAGARASPQPLLLSLVVGFVAWWTVPLAVKEAVHGIHNRWSVYEYIDAYTFWLIYIGLVQNILAPTLVGAVLALANKGREAIVTVGLAALVWAWTVGTFVQHTSAQIRHVTWFPWHAFYELEVRLAVFALLTGMSVCVGGLIVRSVRTQRSRQLRAS